MDEAADDEADHFVEEAVAFEFEHDEVSLLAKLGAVDGAGAFFREGTADGLGHVSAIGGKADEIVSAYQLLAAPAESLHVKGAIDVPGAVGFEG